ncbi:MAG: HAD-IA family hydrolase [Nitrospirae bacterium]|jgi:phosphoglycolate phosphatase|nr:HAD-IA family hydrolase [Nitrospirota bacterium]
MSFELIIFDLDGTLVDTSRDITNALNFALKDYGYEELTVEKTKKIVGEGITRLIEKITSKNNPAMVNQIVERFVQYYSEHPVDYSYVYPGVKEALNMLENCKKAVVSNKRESLSIKILELLDLYRYFDVIIGSDTAPERKPSPVPIFYVLDKMKIKPEQAIIVGDSIFDIEAGKKAGIKTVAVTYGFREKHELLSADFIIDDLRQLHPVITKIDV